MKQIPTRKFATGKSWGQARTDWDDLQDFVLELPDAGPGQRIFIAGGVLTPTSGHTLADTEAGAALDQLDFVSLTAVPVGRKILVGLFNATRKISLRHQMANGAGQGELILAGADSGGDAVTLSDTTQAILLERVGNQFVERDRRGFGGNGLDGPLSADLDAGGNAIVNAKVADRTVTGSSYIPARLTDRSVMLCFRDACTVTLPNPNGSGWQRGDVVLWEQGGATLLFRDHLGNPAKHALGHDRGCGEGAQGWIKVRLNHVRNELEWVLAGMTKGVATGGGGEPGIQRSYAFASFSPLTTDPANTNALVLGALTHSPDVGKWVYIANGGLTATGHASQNANRMQVVRAGSPDVTVGQAARPMFSTQHDRPLLLWAEEYLVLPGSVTHRMEIKNSTTGYTTTLQGGFMAALKLSTGENFVETAGPVTANAPSSGGVPTWIDVATLDTSALGMSSLAAGEYYVLAQTGWAGSVAGLDMHAQLLVDGSPVAEVLAASTGAGHVLSYSAIDVVNFSGGHHVVKLQIGLGAAAGTVTATNATIVLLRKASFEAADSAEDPVETSYSLIVPTAKILRSWSLKADWRSLLLGGCQVHNGASAADKGMIVRLNRNGGNLVPTARIGAGAVNRYAANSWAAAGVHQPFQTTDVFELALGAADNATPHAAKQATLIALPLGPAPV